MITPSVALFSVADMGEMRSQQEDAAPAAQAEPSRSSEPQRMGGANTGGGREADGQLQGGPLSAAVDESVGSAPTPSLEDERGQRGQVQQQSRPSARRRPAQKPEPHAALLSAFMSQKKSARA